MDFIACRQRSPRAPSRFPCQHLLTHGGNGGDNRIIARPLPDRHQITLGAHFGLVIDAWFQRFRRSIEDGGVGKERHALHQQFATIGGCGNPALIGYFWETGCPVRIAPALAIVLGQGCPAHVVTRRRPHNFIGIALVANRIVGAHMHHHILPQLAAGAQQKGIGQPRRATPPMQTGDASQIREKPPLQRF